MIAPALCVAILALSPIPGFGAEETAKDSARESEIKESENQEPEIVATIRARLEVEDSAPYVPASNTIAAKAGNRRTATSSGRSAVSPRARCSMPTATW